VEDLKIYRNERGELHRVDGPAIINPNGLREWYQNGEYHRDDGPAFEYHDGYTAWYQRGLLHRLDGPAIVHPDKTNEWYINGNHVTMQVERWLKQQKIKLPMSESELSFFILSFTAE
jgi:hypothetical protein